MGFSRISYIVNPASQNGATARRWPHLREALPAAHEVLHTTAPREAVTLAKRAAEGGSDLIVSVGGDGTLHEVVSGLMELPADKRPALALVPLGTGGDFKRTVGYPTEARAVAALINRAHTRAIDVGAITFQSFTGERETRHFINIASFGISGVVDREVNGTSKALGGKLSFLFGTLKGLFKFKPVPVELSLDDAPFETRRIMLVAACNGRAFGGGMMVAPTADPSDGVLDIVVFDELPMLDSLRGFGKIYSASHLGGTGVSLRSAKRLYAKSEESVLIDLDGEAPGQLPLEIEVVPKALQLVC